MRQVLSAAVVVALAGVASADIIAPGQSFQTTLAAIPSSGMPNGTVLEDLNAPFNAGSHTGFVRTFVLQGDTTNTLGGLTFVYVLSNNASSTDSVNRFTVNGYQGFTVDASYLAAMPGVVPFDIDRSANGNVMGGDFQTGAGGTTPLNPGTMGRALIFRTNAVAYREVQANVINGSVTSVTSYAPLIPTPGAAALLGLGGLAAARRRR